VSPCRCAAGSSSGYVFPAGCAESDTMSQRARVRARSPARARAAPRPQFRSSTADRDPVRAWNECAAQREAAGQQPACFAGSGAIRNGRPSLPCCQPANGGVYQKIFFFFFCSALRWTEVHWVYSKVVDPAVRRRHLVFGLGGRRAFECATRANGVHLRGCPHRGTNGRSSRCPIAKLCGR